MKLKHYLAIGFGLIKGISKAFKIIPIVLSKAFKLCDLDHIQRNYQLDRAGCKRSWHAHSVAAAPPLHVLGRDRNGRERENMLYEN